MRAPDPPDLIREGTVIQGLRPIEVEGVGAVNGLPGSGGPPDPSIFRDQLIEEMKRHDVADPNQFLELDETALVRVLASIPPGAKRGDPIDIRVVAPKESRAEDLRQGWLLDTRLREQRLLQNVVRQSEVMAIGMGSVLDPRRLHTERRRGNAGRRTRPLGRASANDSQTRSDPATEVPTRQDGQVHCRRGESPILLL